MSTTRVASSWRRGGPLALGLLAGLAVGGGAVDAAGPAGTIYACVLDIPGTRSPNVRIVPENEACDAMATRIQWNAEGPAGPTGPAGAAGAAGAPGAPGAQGPAGPAGSSGLSVAYGTFKDAGAKIAPGKGVNLDLVLPQKGLYAMSAKVAVQGGNVNCLLLKPGFTSYRDESFQGGVGSTLSLQMLIDYATAGGTVRLRCRNFSSKAVFVFHRKITALRLNGFINQGS